MITEDDYAARGWAVQSVGSSFKPDPMVVRSMEENPQSAGGSSVGTQNLLYALVLSLKPKIVLEVGSHIGAGSVWIGAALKENGFGRAYCLEPQEHYYELHTSHMVIADVYKYVRTLRLFSTDEALNRFITEPVDMCFLDANHSYSAARKDLEIVDSLLSDRGIIILDDTGSGHSGSIDPEGKGGVRQALIDFAAENPDYSISFLDNPFWLNPCGIALAIRHKGADLRTTAQRETD